MGNGTQANCLFEWGVGLAKEDSSVEKAVDCALGGVRSFPPRLVLVMATYSVEVHKETLRQIRTRVAEHPTSDKVSPCLIGTTVTRIIGSPPSPQKGLSICVLASPLLEVQSVRVPWREHRDLPRFKNNLKSKIARWLTKYGAVPTVGIQEQHYGLPDAFFLAIGPGFGKGDQEEAVYEDQDLIEAVSELSGYRVPVFGLSSGTELGFDKELGARQFYQDSIVRGNLILALVRTACAFGIAMGLGYSTRKSGGGPFCITDKDFVKGREVRTIDNKPAQAFFNREVRARRWETIAVAVDAHGSFTTLMPAEMADESRGIAFSRDVHRESAIFLRDTSPTRLAKSMKDCIRWASEVAARKAGTPSRLEQQDLCLVVSCRGRFAYLESKGKGDAETKALHKAWPSMGFFGSYGAGEFGMTKRNIPVARNWFCSALVLKQAYTPTGLSRIREIRGRHLSRFFVELAPKLASVEISPESEHNLFEMFREAIETTVKCQLAQVFILDKGSPGLLILSSSSEIYSRVQNEYRAARASSPGRRQRGGLFFRTLQYNLTDPDDSGWLPVKAFKRKKLQREQTKGKDLRLKFQGEWDYVFGDNKIFDIVAIPFGLARESSQEQVPGVILLVNHIPDPLAGNLTRRFDPLDLNYVQQVAAVFADALSQIRIVHHAREIDRVMIVRAAHHHLKGIRAATRCADSLHSYVDPTRIKILDRTLRRWACGYEATLRSLHSITGERGTSKWEAQPRELSANQLHDIVADTIELSLPPFEILQLPKPELILEGKPSDDPVAYIDTEILKAVILELLDNAREALISDEPHGVPLDYKGLARESIMIKLICGKSAKILFGDSGKPLRSTKIKEIAGMGLHEVRLWCSAASLNLRCVKPPFKFELALPAPQTAITRS